MRETKQCKKNECQPTKQCFETTNARKKTYIRKTKNIYAYICEDEEEESSRNLHCTNGMQMQQKETNSECEREMKAKTRNKV